MDIKIIREKVRNKEYDLSEHAHKERQQEEISVEEIVESLLKGKIISSYSV